MRKTGESGANAAAAATLARTLPVATSRHRWCLRTNRTMTYTTIQGLLGDKASFLLNHQSKTVDRQRLYLPSPTFVDDVWLGSGDLPEFLAQRRGVQVEVAATMLGDFVP